MDRRRALGDRGFVPLGGGAEKGCASVEGKVWLVGAGPGDPELLTLKAARILSSADVVVHDRLVGAGVMNLAPAAARRLYVGKRKAHHALAQGDVNDLLVALAREGLCVVRLKGGDPFMFGRGGEELLACRAAGVACEVIPGVSAAVAASSAVGAPLTHRSLSQAVTFVTGHAAVASDGRPGDPDLDWSALAGANHTVAVYMGVTTAPMIAQRLMAAGRAGSTPVAVVEDVSLPTERRIATTLQNLPADIAGVKGPAVILIGEVAAMAEVCEDRGGSALSAVADGSSTSARILGTAS